MRLDLSNVTLVTIDDLKDNPTKSNIRYTILSKVIEYAKTHIDFHDIKLLTPLNGFSTTFNNITDYSKWIIKELPFIIESDYYLIIQWDGFIVNPMNWLIQWFDYDYIGGGHILQNGGFSFRKAETMRRVSDISILNSFGKTENTELYWLNEDCYYEYFFEHSAKNLHIVDNRFNAGWYEYLQSNNLVFKTPYVLDTVYADCDSNKFSSFFRYDSNSFGWHWSGMLDMNTTIRFYKQLGVFTDTEINEIYSYLKLRSIR